MFTRPAVLPALYSLHWSPSSFSYDFDLALLYTAHGCPDAPERPLASYISWAIAYSNQRLYKDLMASFNSEIANLIGQIRSLTLAVDTLAKRPSFQVSPLPRSSPPSAAPSVAPVRSDAPRKPSASTVKDKATLAPQVGTSVKALPRPPVTWV